MCAWDVQVIASFLDLLYKYVGVHTTKQVIPDELKGRAIHHSFPMTLFVVYFSPHLFPTPCASANFEV